MTMDAVAHPTGTDLAAVDDGVRTYHGRPVLKEPAWTWEVPWYLFFGGMAGASSMLAAGATLTGRSELARRARLVGAVSAGVSTPLLIADLGRPARFLNMLRVFKPTSVMSMGSWILASYSGATSVSAALAELDRLPRLRALADVGAGALGAGMLTYTGALVADTAIPVWHEARHELPALFAASGMASAGAAATLLTPPRHAGPARRLAVTGAAAELSVDAVMRRRLGEIGEVYEQEEAGRFHKAAATATAVGGALVAAGGARRRWLTVAGSVALLAGSVCQRWSVYRAGFQSARDPRATIRPQRERLRRGQGHRRA
jgi:formate-dependent nitrite reductase membrane component NrfD